MRVLNKGVQAKPALCPGPEAWLPTAAGRFRIRTYERAGDGPAHVALVHGNVDAQQPALVRVHSECLTGETLASLRCDCGPQLQRALALLGKSQAGVLVYLRQEGRGIGLPAKVAAYALQDRGLDTYDANVELGLPADARTYEDAAFILRDLGVRRLRLLTNNPDKERALASFGFEIVERIALLTEVRAENARYLDAKRRRFGHLIPAPETMISSQP